MTGREVDEAHRTVTPPTSMVRSSGASAARSPPTATRLSGRSVRASRMTVGPLSEVVTTRRPSPVSSSVTLAGSCAANCGAPSRAPLRVSKRWTNTRLELSSTTAYSVRPSGEKRGP